MVRYLALLLPVALILGCILHYGVNVPFADDWDLSSLVSKAANHKIQFKHLLQQHNEHRIVFVKVVVASLAWMGYWDLRVQMFLSVVLCSITAGNLCLLIKRTLFLSSRAEWAMAFCMTVLLFSPVQYENWLWGFQCAFFVPPLCLTTSWLVLMSKRPLSVKFWLSALLTAVATFSFSTGVFGWLLSFPLFLVAVEQMVWRKTLGWLAYWFGAFGVCMGAYFIGYHQPLHSTRILTGFHPFLYVEYALVFLGGNSFRTAFDQGTIVPLLAGMVVTTLFLVSLGFLWLRRRSPGLVRNSMPWTALGAFAIASAFLCALGRRPYLPARQALESRYTTVSLLLLVSLLGLLALVSQDLKSRMELRGRKILSWAGGVALAILAVGYTLNLSFSFEQMATLRSYHLDGKAALQYSKVLRDAGLAEAIMTATLYPSTPALRGFVRLLDGANAFRPALANDPRMQDAAASDVNKSKFGRFESISMIDNQYVVAGWAILPGRNERADGIVLAFRDPAGAWIALTMAGERTERLDLSAVVGNRSPKNIGWRSTIPATVLPAGAQELSAWAIDARTGNSYQLDGFQTVP
jgi:hypothetical protein